MKTIVSLDKAWFPTCMTGTLGSVSCCYTDQVLDNANIELLGLPTERYEGREEIEQCTVVVISSERE